MAPLPRPDGLKTVYPLLEKASRPDAVASDEHLVRNTTRLAAQNAMLIPGDCVHHGPPVNYDWECAGEACYVVQDPNTGVPAVNSAQQVKPEDVDSGYTPDTHHFQTLMRSWLISQHSGAQASALSDEKYEELEKELRNLTKQACDLIKEERFGEAHLKLANELQVWDRSPHLVNSLFTLQARRIQANALYQDAMANRHHDPSLTKVIEARDLIRRNICLLQTAESPIKLQEDRNNVLLKQCEEVLTQIRAQPELIEIPAENAVPIYQNLSPPASEDPWLSRSSALCPASQSTAPLQPTSLSNPISILASNTNNEQNEWALGGRYDSEAQRTLPTPYQNNSRSEEKASPVCDPRKQFAEPRRVIEPPSQGETNMLEGLAQKPGSTTRIGEQCDLAIQLKVRSNAGR